MCEVSSQWLQINKETEHCSVKIGREMLF